MTFRAAINRWLNDSRTVYIVMLIYLLVAMAFNIANPVFESYDEEAHFRNIIYIQRTGDLPIVESSSELLEGHQPPLYYAITALLTLPFRADDIERYTERNPFWGYLPGIPGRDNKNQYIHGPEQGFPYSGTGLQVHTARLLSTLFGLAGVWITYQLALNLLPGNHPLALAAASLAAFTPTLTFVSASVSNDAARMVIPPLAMLLMLRLWEQRTEPALHQWVVLGIMLSAAVLNKLTDLPLLLVSALLGVLLARRHRSWRVFLAGGAILLGSVALAAGWWFVRNIYLYGDPTAISGMEQVWQGRVRLSLLEIILTPTRTRYNYWVAFGWGNVVPPLWAYTLFDILWLLAIAGLVWRLVDHWKGQKWPVAEGKVLLIVVWVLLSQIAVMWFAMRHYNITGRIHAPYAAVISLGLIAGWARFLPAHWRAGTLPIIGATAFLGCVAALVGVLIPAYTPSPRLTEAEARQQMQVALDWQVGDDLRLMGYTIAPQIVRPGDQVSVTFYWQVLAPPEEELTTFVQLYGAQNVLAGQRDTYPGLGNDPTRYWQAGEIIADAIRVPVSPEVTGPQMLHILAGMYRFQEGVRLPVQDAAGNDISGLPTIGMIKLADTSPTPSTPAYSLDITFSGGHKLTGYDLDRSEARAGDSLTVTLHWQAGGPLPADYRVFFHLTAPDSAQPLAQGDGPPLGGFFPTTQWAEGDTFTDPHTIILPTDLSAGRYVLRVGLYDPVSGARLPLADGSGDSVTLAEIEVSR